MNLPIYPQMLNNFTKRRSLKTKRQNKRNRKTKSKRLREKGKRTKSKNSWTSMLTLDQHRKLLNFRKELRNTRRFGEAETQLR